MVFSEKMLEIQSTLQGLGHDVYASEFAMEYVGKSEKSKEELTVHHKHNNDAIRKFFQKIRLSDAILVLNFDRRGIRHYIGGNTLMEIGFAHVLEKKIFLLHPIPDIEYYRSEIEAVRPTVINGDLTKIC